MLFYRFSQSILHTYTDTRQYFHTHVDTHAYTRTRSHTHMGARTLKSALAHKHTHTSLKIAT